MLTLPFPRHPHFVLLTPDYVPLCAAVDTSGFLMAVVGRSQCGFCRGRFSKVLIPFCANSRGCVFKVISLKLLFLRIDAAAHIHQLAPGRLWGPVSRRASFYCRVFNKGKWQK